MPRPSGRGSFSRSFCLPRSSSNSNRPISPTITRHGDRALDLPTTSSLWTLSPPKRASSHLTAKSTPEKRLEAPNYRLVEAGIATIQIWRPFRSVFPTRYRVLESEKYQRQFLGVQSGMLHRLTVGGDRSGGCCGDLRAVRRRRPSPTLLTHELLEVPRTAREFPRSSR